MHRPTIISCAVTGGADTKEMNPAVPVKPEGNCRGSLAAHGPARRLCIFMCGTQRQESHAGPREKCSIIRGNYGKIRKSGSEVILNLTTGWGGVIRVNPENPVEPVPGARLKTVEERVAHILQCKPIFVPLMWPR